MIQPLKSSRSSWSLFWIDLDEPVQSGQDFILPTLLIVTDSRGVPVAPPEMLEELDQPRIESFLGQLIDQHGAPERLIVGESEEWDPEGWRIFAEDYRLTIQFKRFHGGEGHDLKVLTKTITQGQSSAERPEGTDIAAGLVNSALRVRSESKRIALLKKAIDSDAGCAPARIELADVEFRRGDWTAALRGYDEVIDREYPRWSGRGPKWWDVLETRPYLRAIYGRAMTLWHQQRYAGAAETLVDLLETNSRDHQGARFLIPMLHMLADDYEAANSAFLHYEGHYPNDYAEPSMLFGRALAHAVFGRETDSIEFYRRGILRNFYIAPMLLDLPVPPDQSIWQPNDRAEAGYAREFIESYAVLWDRNPSALRFLREAHHDMETRVADIIALRQQMFDFQDQRYEPNYKQLWQELLDRDAEISA